MYECVIVTGKALLALIAHFNDSDFKMREILFFAKPFSEVAHTATEIEKAIKTGLATYGIGQYDLSLAPPLDTVSSCNSDMLLQYSG